MTHSDSFAELEAILAQNPDIAVVGGSDVVGGDKAVKRNKSRHAKGPTESDSQCAVIRWRNSSEYLHPALWTLHSVPNGGKRHVAVAKKMKAEGVVKGVADLFLPVPRSVRNANEDGGYEIHHGLYIEMKRPKGRQSTAQKKWQRHCVDYGYQYALCLSLIHI